MLVSIQLKTSLQQNAMFSSTISEVCMPDRVNNAGSQDVVAVKSFSGRNLVIGE